MPTSLNTPSSWPNVKRDAAVVAANIACHAIGCERKATRWSNLCGLCERQWLEDQKAVIAIGLTSFTGANLVNINVRQVSLGGFAQVSHRSMARSCSLAQWTASSFTMNVRFNAAIPCHLTSTCHLLPRFMMLAIANPCCDKGVSECAPNG